MAAKKKAGTKKKSTTAVVASKRWASTVLPALKPLDAVRHEAYLSSFTSKQCIDWGNDTKSSAVLAEAETGAAFLLRVLKSKTIAGYVPQRLTFLVQQLIELEASILAHAGDVRAAERATRDVVLAQANVVRQQLKDGIDEAASSNDSVLARAQAANNVGSADVVRQSLESLASIAEEVRGTPTGAVLLDDAGVTPAFITAARALSARLQGAREQTLGATSSADSPATNIIEGRVLRELGFARSKVQAAREADKSVPAFPTGRLLARVANSKATPKVPDAPTPL